MDLNPSRPWFLLFSLPLVLGCFLVPDPEPEPNPPPPIEGEECSNDHTDYYVEAEAGALIEGTSDACNSTPYFSSGGGGLGQGGGGGSPTFHFEPTLHVFNDLQPTEEPAITWTIRELDTGVIIDEQGFELFESDIDYETDGFRVTSIFFIGADLREQNIRVEAQMDVVDLEGNVTAVTPAGAVFLQ